MPHPSEKSESQYNIVVNGRSTGSYSTLTLVGMIKSGLLTPKSLVWKTGMNDWTPASTIPELAALFSSQNQSDSAEATADSTGDMTNPAELKKEFVFDDIVSLSNEDLKKIVKAVNEEELIFALKEKKKDILYKFLYAFEDLRFFITDFIEMGSIFLDMSRYYQRRIVRVIRDLSETGEITVPEEFYFSHEHDNEVYIEEADVYDSYEFPRVCMDIFDCTRGIDLSVIKKNISKEDYDLALWPYRQTAPDFRKIQETQFRVLRKIKELKASGKIQGKWNFREREGGKSMSSGREKIFTFEDIPLLDDECLKTALRQTDISYISRALVDAEKAICVKIFSVLPEKGVAELKEEISAAEISDSGGIATSRRQILVNLQRTIEDTGSFSLPKGYRFMTSEEYIFSIEDYCLIKTRKPFVFEDFSLVGPKYIRRVCAHLKDKQEMLTNALRFTRNETQNQFYEAVGEELANSIKESLQTADESVATWGKCQLAQARIIWIYLMLEMCEKVK